MFEGGKSDTSKLGDVASFFGGSSLPEGVEFMGQPNGTLLMKVSDMNSVGNEQHVRATAFWTGAQPRGNSVVHPGAVVLPKRGASIATNKKRLIDRPTALDPNLMGVQPKDGSLLTDYLFEWFRRFDLTSITSGSSVPQLNKKDLAPLRILVPPLELQEQFSRQAHAVREQRAVVMSALAADDELFASLQSRAFKGEL